MHGNKRHRRRHMSGKKRDFGKFFGFCFGNKNQKNCAHMFNLLHSLYHLDKQSAFRLFYLNHAFLNANATLRLFQSLGSNSGNDVPFLMGLLYMVCSGLGGALITDLFLGNSQFLLASDIYILYYLVVWILVLYSPFGIVHKLTSHFVPFEMIAYMIEGLFCANIVMDAVSAGLELYPNSFIIPVLFAMLSMVGGSVLGTFLVNQYVQSGASKASSELSDPSLTTKLSLVLSIFYYVSKVFYGTESFYVLDLHSFMSKESDMWSTLFSTVNISPELLIRVVFIAHFLHLFIQQVVARFGRQPSPPPSTTKKQSSKQKEKIN